MGGAPGAWRWTVLKQRRSHPAANVGLGLVRSSCLSGRCCRCPLPPLFGCPNGKAELGTSGDGAWMLGCVNPAGTLEGVPEVAFCSLLDTACSLQFVFLCVFPNKEVELLGVDGGSGCVTPAPAPVCRQRPVVIPEISQLLFGSLVS